MGNWNQNEFEYLKDTEPGINDQWKYERNKTENKENQTEQNDKRSLNGIFSNGLNNQTLETDLRILEALFKFALKELVAHVLYFTYNFWIRT